MSASHLRLIKGGPSLIQQGGPQNLYSTSLSRLVNLVEDSFTILHIGEFFLNGPCLSICGSFSDETRLSIPNMDKLQNTKINSKNSIPKYFGGARFKQWTS